MININSNYVVYSHKNNINNKVYIGITCRNPESRWRGGEGYKDQPRFYAAINKYGWNNFTHDVLYENLSEEEACKKERELIEINNSTNPKFGYNAVVGGKISSTGKTQWITDGNHNSKISIDAELPDGWRKGRTFNKIYYTNGQVTKLFKEGEQPEGWRKGASYKTTKNTVVITNGNIHRFVKKEEKLPDGWYYGASPSMRANSNKIVITDGLTENYVDKDSIDLEDLKPGWVFMKKTTLIKLKKKKERIITNPEKTRSYKVSENFPLPPKWKEGIIKESKYKDKIYKGGDASYPELEPKIEIYNTPYGFWIENINNPNYKLKIYFNDIKTDKENYIMPEGWEFAKEIKKKKMSI